jgi:hypothetical protein
MAFDATARSHVETIVLGGSEHGGFGREESYQESAPRVMQNRN